jgi:hypothetical protein
MEKFCKENNLTFKILLLNARTHNLDFEQLCPNINVVFMPLRLTSIMDQGVIASLKTYYL